MNSVSPKSKLLGDAALLSAASVIAFVFSIPASIISAKLLGPAILGVFKIVSLIQNYSSYSQLGFLQALQRETTILRGKGDVKQADHVTDVALTNTAILLGATLAVLWALYTLGLFQKKGITALIMLFCLLIIMVTRVNSAISAYMISKDNFAAISLNNALSGMLGPILAIGLVLYYRNVESLLAGSFITALCTFGIYLMKLGKMGFRFRPRLDWQTTCRIWKPNVIIYVNNLTGQLYWTIDLLMITIFLDIKNVGLYGTALAATNIATNFTARINKPILRRIMFQRGQHGFSDMSWYRHYLAKPLTVYMFYSCLWMGLLCVSYVWLINYYLVAYRDAVWPLVILSFGLMVYQSMPIFSFFINVTDQFRLMILTRFVFVLLNMALDVLAIKGGYGIRGVAIVSTISYVIYTGFMAAVVFTQIEGRTGFRSAILHMGRLLVVSVILSGYAWGYYAVIHGSSGKHSVLSRIPDLLLINAGYLALIILVFSLMFFHQRIHRELLSILGTVYSRFVKPGTVRV
ncbi:MAG: hypothetical protein LJE96_02890 [Deltaproteobacteria bacterium]|nr:hypothetical protein [Deltaproteobacteria bacterium]